MRCFEHSTCFAQSPEGFEEEPNPFQAAADFHYSNGHYPQHDHPLQSPHVPCRDPQYSPHSQQTNYGYHVPPAPAPHYSSGQHHHYRQHGSDEHKEPHHHYRPQDVRMHTDQNRHFDLWIGRIPMYVKQPQALLYYIEQQYSVKFTNFESSKFRRARWGTRFSYIAPIATANVEMGKRLIRINRLNLITDLGDIDICVRRYK